MKYTIKIPAQIDGISAETADPEEPCSVVSTDFLTDSDDDLFYESLGGFSGLFLMPYLQEGRLASQIDHFLVLIKDASATVFINELRFKLEGIAARAIRKGETVSPHDFSGIRKVDFVDLSIPDDVAVVFYFTVGWRRGMYFDFAPTSGTKLEHINHILGSCYEELLYASAHKISKETRLRLQELRWFPFIRFLNQEKHPFYRLVARIREGKPIERAEADLIDWFDNAEISAIGSTFSNYEFLQPHAAIIQAGIERFLNQDYVSCINNIWPRLEGILQFTFKTENRQRHNDLVNKLEQKLGDDLRRFPGLYFPQLFINYLNSIYFPPFKKVDDGLPVSRHTIGHGVADPSQYNRKNALLGILILDQLCCYIDLSSSGPQ